MKIVFVCTGNICRSPAAEGVFRKLAQDQSWQSRFTVASRATSSYTEGEPPDGRMVEVARKRGYQLQGEAIPFSDDDFTAFDLILAMDNTHLTNLLGRDRSGEHHHKIRSFTTFCRVHAVNEVPDPYYGDEDRFEYVLDLIEDACLGLMDRLKTGPL